MSHHEELGRGLLPGSQCVSPPPPNVSEELLTNVIEFPQYNVAKFGVRGLFSCMRATNPSIRSNLVTPWTIRSGIMDTATLDALEQITDLADINDAVACLVFIATRRDVRGVGAPAFHL